MLTQSTMAATVERILDRSMIRNRVHYLCAWKGLGDDSNTWESRVDLIADGYGNLIRKFEKARKSDEGGYESDASRSSRSSRSSRGRSPGRGRSKSPSRSRAKSPATRSKSPMRRRAKSPSRRRSRSRSSSVSRASPRASRPRRRSSVGETPQTPTRRSARVREKYGTQGSPSYAVPRSIQQVLEDSAREHELYLQAKRVEDGADEQDELKLSLPAKLRAVDHEPLPSELNSAMKMVEKAASPQSSKDQESIPSPRRHARTVSPERASRSTSPVKTTHFARGHFSASTQTDSRRPSVQSSKLWALGVVMLIGSVVAGFFVEELNEELIRKGLASIGVVISLLVTLSQSDVRSFTKRIVLSLGFRLAAEVLLASSNPGIQDYLSFATVFLALADFAIIVCIVEYLLGRSPMESNATVAMLLLALATSVYSDSLLLSSENMYDNIRLGSMIFGTVALSLSPVPKSLADE